MGLGYLSSCVMLILSDVVNNKKKGLKACHNKVINVADILSYLLKASHCHAYQ